VILTLEECSRLLRTTFVIASLSLLVTPLSGQLRPLEPLNWRVFETSQNAHASVRFGFLQEQRASLAGTRGNLLELGELQLALRVADAVMLEFAGTPQRFFEDKSRFAPPTGGALTDDDGDRHDSGDYRAGTAVRLTSDLSPTLIVLRFGTRLPTTDNRVGLDRDQIDFFAMLGFQHRRGPLRIALEGGLGINGTRLDTYEQSDVVQYTMHVAWERTITPFLTLLGQDDLKERTIRGNEDLGEARVGVRFGRARWLEATFVAGYRDFSPTTGFLIGGGYAFGWR
jgi:hypothetical protein